MKHLKYTNYIFLLKHFLININLLYLKMNNSNNINKKTCLTKNKSVSKLKSKVSIDYDTFNVDVKSLISFYENIIINNDDNFFEKTKNKNVKHNKDITFSPINHKIIQIKNRSFNFLSLIKFWNTLKI